MDENGSGTQRVSVEVRPDFVVEELQSIIAGLSRDLALSRSINRELMEQIATLQRDRLAEMERR